jgi:hypothetical protein
MNLCDMINELLSIPEYEITVHGYDTSELNVSRIAFLNSLRNTLHKEIDSSLNKNELKDLINTFELKLEKNLIIALYRKYLWLEPTDALMYHNFIKYINDSSTEKKQNILQFINNNNFVTALAVVENIFNDLFTGPTLIHPIKMRSLANMAWEYCLLNGTSAENTTTRQVNYTRLRYLTPVR